MCRPSLCSISVVDVRNCLLGTGSWCTNNYKFRELFELEVTLLYTVKALLFLQEISIPPVLLLPPGRSPKGRYCKTFELRPLLRLFFIRLKDDFLQRIQQFYISLALISLALRSLAIFYDLIKSNCVNLGHH